MSKDRRAECRVTENGAIELLTVDPDYFVGYFSLDTDYDAVITRYGGIAGVAAEYSKGIRMLRQDPFETLISFIISANNHIPRIRGIIERLCLSAGRECGGYRAFPTPESLKDFDADSYHRLGAGYRSLYLAETVRKILGGFDLEALRHADTEFARRELLKLLGVGPKVADCIMLFSLDKRDVFPVDTWIKKSARIHFGIEAGDTRAIAKLLTEKFGNDSGIIQQYIYYYVRNNKNI